MANVNINFNGKDYLLSCDNGQEEHLIELAEYLNKKFKELKSLVLEYKENKDKEIDKLSSDLNSFKKMVDQNKIEYESMLDKATQSIEEFIEKSSQNKPLQ